MAVFDSGVGGLTVLHECLVSLPNEDFLYLGDTARFPYGVRSRDELLGFALELTEILLEYGAKMIVVACNSATAAALPTLKRELAGRVPVVGVVRPEARAAATATANGRVGLVATPATVASGAYAEALRDVSFGEATLYDVASDDLASVIQGGGEVDERTVACVERACAPLLEAGVDTVILGCTHYPLVKPIFERCLGRDVTVITSGQAVVEEIERELASAEIAAPGGRMGTYRFLATGDTEEFRRLGTRFLHLPIARVDPVQVDPAAGAAA